MSSEAIRPSSLDGIKRLAKQLKGKYPNHARDLDAAARAAGFQNFLHARNAFRDVSKQEPAPAALRTFLSVFWKERETGKTGRETWAVSLPVLWSELVTPAQLKINRHLGMFRPHGPDHLEWELMLHSQSAARRCICAAARVMQFMDATKLRPSKAYSSVFPGRTSRNAIPGLDHLSVWYDSKLKRHLFVDEPYEAAVKGLAEEREAWASRHGFVVAKPEWAGMYAPDLGSRLYLVADGVKGVPLGPITAALNSLPAPIIEEAWDGESAPFDWFISPGRQAELEARKPRLSGS